jgi:ABC-type amino acid transport system permease subunit
VEVWRGLPIIVTIFLIFFALPAVVVVAATGIYQMDKGGWDYGDFWVSATITILVVILLVNVFFFMTTKPGLG